MKDEILKRNFNLIKKINPNLKPKYILERIKSIEWELSEKPYTCEVSVNSSCNNRCVFCYNHPSVLTQNNAPSLNKIYQILYKGAKEKSWIASIIGGEPTLRKDITEISLFARKIGYKCVKICTNGRKLSDKKYAKSLIKSGFNSFDISLHSINPKTHDDLVGIKGAWEETVKAMKTIKELNSELATAQVLNSLNYKDFPEFFDFAYNELKINYFNIIVGNYYGAMKINKTKLAANIVEVSKYVKKAMKMVEKSGFPLFTRILINFPPCLFPEYLNIIADWEKNSPRRETVMLYDETSTTIAEINENRSVKIDWLCPRCILKDKCRGFNKEHTENIKRGSIEPVKKIPKFKIKTTFKYDI